MTHPTPRRRRRWIPLLLALAVAALGAMEPAVARAQSVVESARLRAQRDTLERIRRERQQLEQRAVELQNTVHDLGDEVSNLDRQADATARIVKALDSQLSAINDEVADASAKQARAESELEVKRAALHRRLIDIYKRGPLFATEAMLSARSFGELVARYKYLHLLTLHDRGLVTRVEQLRDQVAREHQRLLSLQSALQENRSDKQNEEERLRTLERQRQATLAQTQRQAALTEDRLARLKATETQLASAITALETERHRAEVAHPNVAHVGSSIRASDYGKLEWPVEGPMIYTFGKAQTASNTTIRWNGDGIKAPVNTAVHAIAAGKVVSVRQLGTYGLTVIIDHGGGDYSIYGSLARADVREQQTVAAGQVIGGVGISDPDLPPHLHFEIRHGGPAVDPATWMK